MGARKREGASLFQGRSGRAEPLHWVEHARSAFHSFGIWQCDIGDLNRQRALSKYSISYLAPKLLSGILGSNGTQVSDVALQKRCLARMQCSQWRQQAAWNNFIPGKFLCKSLHQITYYNCLQQNINYGVYV